MMRALFTSSACATSARRGARPAGATTGRSRGWPSRRGTRSSAKTPACAAASPTLGRRLPPTALLLRRHRRRRRAEVARQSATLTQTCKVFSARSMSSAVRREQCFLIAFVSLTRNVLVVPRPRRGRRLLERSARHVFLGLLQRTATLPQQLRHGPGPGPVEVRQILFLDLSRFPPR